jgi:P27 family predicted phage terminase small subunit
MKPGPTPKPTQFKVLEGNRGKRPLNKNEPKCGSGTTAPKEISKEAKKEWNRIYSYLRRAGVVTALDRNTLYDYCEAYALLKNANQMLEEKGLLVINSSGNIDKSPYFFIAQAASKRMRAQANELGLTPAARSRIVVDKPDKHNKSPLEGFLSARKGS